MVRLVTETDNVAAQAVVEKLGFHLVAEWAEMITENVVSSESRNSQWAGENETEVLWKYLQASETYRKAAGLYTILYHWFSLEKHDLEGFVEQREAITHKSEEGEVNGLMLIDHTTAREWRENTIQTCYIDGDYDAVLDMTRFLENHCCMLGVKKIYAFTPNQKPITTALEKYDFKMPDETSMIYENRL